MRPLSILIAAALTALLSTPSLLAQDVFETVSGNSYSGRVLSNDGSSIEIETTDGAKMKLPIESLTPVTQYRLERAKTADDAKSQLALADWCMGRTLYEEARTHFRKALAADATMAEEINAKVTVARTTAAKELLARAKSLQATKPQESRRLLSTMVQELPLEDATKEARQLLADETATRKKESLARKPKPAASDAGGGAAGGAGGDGQVMRASGEPFSEATHKTFQPIIDAYHKMLDSTQDGLLKGDSQAIKEFEKALKEGEKIRKLAEKIRAGDKGDEEVTEALALVDSKLEEAEVDARLNLVDNYMLRTSYNQAADVVKEGMAVYPKNESLRAAMGRVTAASADNGGGDWVVVGRR